MSDLINRQTAIDALNEYFARIGKLKKRGLTKGEKAISLDTVGAIKTLPSAQPEQRWVPIKWHECTDEDREKYGFNEDICYVFDCNMPDDNQEILVTTSRGHVEKDVCYIDDGFSLDSGWDWIEDIVAWKPLPEPWKGEKK